MDPECIEKKRERCKLKFQEPTGSCQFDSCSCSIYSGGSQGKDYISDVVPCNLAVCACPTGPKGSRRSSQSSSKRHPVGDTIPEENSSSGSETICKCKPGSSSSSSSSSRKSSDHGSHMPKMTRKEMDEYFSKFKPCFCDRKDQEDDHICAAELASAKTGPDQQSTGDKSTSHHSTKPATKTIACGCTVPAGDSLRGSDRSGSRIMSLLEGEGYGPGDLLCPYATRELSGQGSFGGFTQKSAGGASAGGGSADKGSGICHTQRCIEQSCSRADTCTCSTKSGPGRVVEYVSEPPEPQEPFEMAGVPALDYMYYVGAAASDDLDYPEGAFVSSDLPLTSKIVCKCTSPPPSTTITLPSGPAPPLGPPMEPIQTPGDQQSTRSAGCQCLKSRQGSIAPAPAPEPPAPDQRSKRSAVCECKSLAPSTIGGGPDGYSQQPDQQPKSASAIHSVTIGPVVLPMQQPYPDQQYTGPIIPSGGYPDQQSGRSSRCPCVSPPAAPPQQYPPQPDQRSGRSSRCPCAQAPIASQQQPSPPGDYLPPPDQRSARSSRCPCASSPIAPMQQPISQPGGYPPYPEQQPGGISRCLCSSAPIAPEQRSMTPVGGYSPYPDQRPMSAMPMYQSPPSAHLVPPPPCMTMQPAPCVGEQQGMQYPGFSQPMGGSMAPPMAAPMSPPMMGPMSPPMAAPMQAPMGAPMQMGQFPSAGGYDYCQPISMGQGQSPMNRPFSAPQMQEDTLRLLKSMQAEKLASIGLSQPPPDWGSHDTGRKQLEREVRECKCYIAEQEHEIDRLTGHVESLSKKREGRSKRSESKCSCASIGSQDNALKQQLEELQKECSTIQEKLLKTEKEFTDIKTIVQNEENIVEAMQTECKKIINDKDKDLAITGLQTSLEAIKAENDNLMELLKRAGELSDEAKAELTQRLNCLEKQFVMVRTKLKDHEEQFCGIRGSLKEKDKMIQDIVNNNNNKKAAVEKEKDSCVSALKQALDDAKCENAKLQGMLTKMVPDKGDADSVDGSKMVVKRAAEELGRVLRQQNEEAHQKITNIVEKLQSELKYTNRTLKDLAGKPRNGGGLPDAAPSNSNNSSLPCGPPDSKQPRRLCSKLNTKEQVQDLLEALCKCKPKTENVQRVVDL